MQLLLIVVISIWHFAAGFTSRTLFNACVRNSAQYGPHFSLSLAESNSPEDSLQETESKPASKGFGAKKVEIPVEKDAGTITYENQAKRGVPEYNIFIRPTNGTDTEWVPVGSMTIPRDTKVAKAVFEVEQELLKGTFKLYPKLKKFYDIRQGKEGIFEYGYCLKAFPDEPIQIVVKEDSSANRNFFTNWYIVKLSSLIFSNMIQCLIFRLGKITNPIDTSELKNPGEMTLKQ